MAYLACNSSFTFPTRLTPRKTTNLHRVKARNTPDSMDRKQSLASKRNRPDSNVEEKQNDVKRSRVARDLSPSSQPVTVVHSATYASGAPAVSEISKLLRTETRQLVSSLKDIDSELQILQRIRYKNRHQFRSAKWFQSIDKCKRCMERLNGRNESKESLKAYEHDGSSEAASRQGPGNQTSSFSASFKGKPFALRKGPAREALASIHRVYESMWPAPTGETATNPPVGKNKPAKLNRNRGAQDVALKTEQLIPAKRSSAPTRPPETSPILTSCQSILKASLLLGQLILSCQASWR